MRAAIIFVSGLLLPGFKLMAWEFSVFQAGGSSSGCGACAPIWGQSEWGAKAS